MFKKCKGKGKAIGEGCGESKQIFKYGLCRGCFIEWVYNTKAGNEMLKKTLISSKRMIDRKIKESNKEKKESLKTKSDYEKELQTIVNWIVREIDKDKGCISCEHGWNGNFTRQRHAGHRLSVGSTPELRFNLLNIFGQCSICNNWFSGNQINYEHGLQWCYGIELYDLVCEQKKLYLGLKLTIEELKDAIKNAKSVKKRINAGEEMTRQQINELIGIYKNLL